MNLSNAVVLEAPPQAVWSLLLDVDRFSACIPGVEEVRPIDDRTFDGTILASVGPMSGTFGFRARILEAEPLRALTARVDGTDTVTRSTVAADMRMTLSPVADQGTELACQLTVDVHGRLAIVGDMILRATAAVMLQEFATRLRRQLAVATTG